jgi:hypothetical protein
MMNIRNATHAGDGVIECEYEHPKYGWIPYAASINDTEESGRAIYAEALKGEVGEPKKPTKEQAEYAAKLAKIEADAAAAKGDAKLSALADMSPAQVRAWVVANVANLADAKDVLATLAVAVSVLSRRL